MKPPQAYQKGFLPWKLVSLVFVKNVVALITTNVKILGIGDPQLNGIFCGKKKTSAYLLHYVRAVLGWEGSKQLILIVYETKSLGKQDFTKPKPFHLKHHRLKSIAKSKAGSWGNPGDWQLWKLWYPQPQDRCPRGAENTEGWDKLLNWTSKKEKQFSYKWGTLQQAPVWPKAIVFLRTCRAYILKGTLRCSPNVLQCWSRRLHFGHTALGGKKASFADASLDLTIE